MSTSQRNRHVIPQRYSASLQIRIVAGFVGFLFGLLSRSTAIFLLRINGLVRLNADALFRSSEIAPQALRHTLR